MSTYQKNKNIFDIPSLGNIKFWQDAFANQRIEWFGEDNEENLKKNQDDPIRSKNLHDNGWIDQKIIYQFNSHGFRGHDPVESDSHFCVFGDSVSFGVAIRQENLYHEILSKEIGIKSYNFSVSGGSDDSSVRLALRWLPLLKPKFVIWQKTFDHRYEIIGDRKQAVVYGVQAHGGGQAPKISDLHHRMWIEHDENRHLAVVKNICAMRLLCQYFKIPLIEIDIEEFFRPPMDYGRDLLHPGSKCHARIADYLRSDIKSASGL